MRKMEASRRRGDREAYCAIMQVGPQGVPCSVRIADMTDGMLEASILGLGCAAAAPYAPSDDDTEDLLEAIMGEQLRRRWRSNPAGYAAHAA